MAFRLLVGRFYSTIWFIYAIGLLQFPLASAQATIVARGTEQLRGYIYSVLARLAERAPLLFRNDIDLGMHILWHIC